MGDAVTGGDRNAARVTAPQTLTGIAGSHPLCLLTNMGMTHCSLYHSFFMIEFGSAREAESVAPSTPAGDGSEEISNDGYSSIKINIVRKIPQERVHLSNIEEGLAYYVQEAALKCKESRGDTFGTFVITIADGSRYYSTWRGCQDKIFVAFSRLSMPSFTRRVFDLLGSESGPALQHALLNLCYTPILPACGITYDVKISNCYIQLNFNQYNQPDDEDLDLVVISLANPAIMLAAWEALIMERKILVTSKTSSLLPLFCDFLRQLVLPLPYTNTYVPFLPTDLVHIIEAPVPYILGANTTSIVGSEVDLSDTIVIDLDTRAVTVGSTLLEGPSMQSPPQQLVSQMLHELNDIFTQSLGSWIGRSSHVNEGLGKGLDRKAQLEAILGVFIDANLSLISARSCPVKAFFHRPSDNVQLRYDYSRYSERWSLLQGEGSTGFHRRGDLVVGFMKLVRYTPPLYLSIIFICLSLATANYMLSQVRENSFDENIPNFIPCWVEMDDLNFAVYEYADELPLLYIHVKDIKTVVPVALDPENHVFEIVVKQHSSQATYRFVAIEPQSRRLWIQHIEEKMTTIEANSKSSHYHSTNRTTPDNSNRSVESNKDSLRGNAANPSPTDLAVRKLVSRFSASPAQPFCMIFPPDSADKSPNDDRDAEQTKVSLGGDGTDAYIDLSDQHRLTEFRSVLMQTQMVAYLHSSTEMQGFESLFVDEGCDARSVGEALFFNPDIGRYLWRGDSILATLQGVTSREVSADVEGGEGEDPAEKTRSIGKKKADKPASADYDLIFKTTSAESFTPNKDPADSRDELLGGEEATPSAADGGKGKEKGGFMRYLFGNKTEQGSEVNGADKSLERPKHSMHKEADELNKQFSNLLRHIACSHRKCETELNKMLIESRLNIVLSLARHSTADAVTSDNVIPLDLNTDMSTVDNASCAPHLKPFGAARGAAAAVSDSPGGSWHERMWDATRSGLTKAEELEIVKRVKNKFVSHFTEMRRHTDCQHKMTIISVIKGYLYLSQGDNDNAIAAFSEGSFFFEIPRLMSCVTKTFVNVVKTVDTSTGAGGEAALANFFAWTSKQQPVVRMLVYRMVVEMCHLVVSSKVSLAISEARDQLFSLFKARVLPAVMRNNYSHGLFDSKQGLMAENAAHFSYVDKELLPNTKAGSPEVFNEQVVCTALSLSPVELSVQLLSLLRELLRSSFGISQGASRRIRIEPEYYHSCTFQDITSSSAFKSFELQSCQLQMVDFSTVSVPEKIVFFCNIYNTLALHSTMKMWPGNGIFERLAFMRASKYNIGGQYFSLIDIEHGVLRASSCKPMVFGPMTAPMGFKKGDPRSAVALSIAKPFISFQLFTICASSPSLAVMKDPMSLDYDLEKALTAFIAEYVRLDLDKRVLHLPDTFRIYWKDFGGSRNAIIRLLYKFGPKGFSVNLKQMTDNGPRPSIIFSNYDWAPSLII